MFPPPKISDKTILVPSFDVLCYKDSLKSPVLSFILCFFFLFRTIACPVSPDPPCKNPPPFLLVTQVKLSFSPFPRHLSPTSAPGGIPNPLPLSCMSSPFTVHKTLRRCYFYAARCNLTSHPRPPVISFRNPGHAGLSFPPRSPLGGNSRGESSPPYLAYPK